MSGAPAEQGRDRPPVRVLVAEDEAHLGTLLEQYLTGRGFVVTLVRDGRAALDALRAGDFDVALTDVQMPGMDGLALLDAVRGLPLAPEVVVVTGNGAADTALRAMRQGAYDAVGKPYRMAEIELLVRRAADKRALRREVAAWRAAAPVPAPFVTRDPALQALVARLEGAAAAGRPLLLSGEPGTGRRTLARWLHAHAGRGGAFVAVAGHALQGDGTASRYEGGMGKSVPPIALVAAGGTLYVAAVEALAPRLLVALVAAAEAPGGPALIVSSSLTPSALHERLGAPLLARFAQLATVPPLRARPSDVLPLAETLASRLAGQPILLAPDARAALMARPWSGNATELASVMAGALARLATGAVELTMAAFPTDGSATSPCAVEPLEAVERRHVAAALEVCGWHQGHTAAALGISDRALHRMLRRHGLVRPPSAVTVVPPTR